MRVHNRHRCRATPCHRLQACTPLWFAMMLPFCSKPCRVQPYVYMQSKVAAMLCELSALGYAGAALALQQRIPNKQASACVTILCSAGDGGPAGCSIARRVCPLQPHQISVLLESTLN